jgi:hypothetical protein
LGVPVIETDSEGTKSRSGFSKGEKITNNNFTGTAWLQMLVNNDSIYHTSIGKVTFEPGARTNWHKHPGGQILLVTDGRVIIRKKARPLKHSERQCDKNTRLMPSIGMAQRPKAA